MTERAALRYLGRGGSVNIVTTTTEVPYIAGEFPLTWDRSRADPDCWRAFTDYSLTCILRNLAVAGALCAAFYTGAEAEWRRMWRGDASAKLDWYPGCGREVPR